VVIDEAYFEFSGLTVLPWIRRRPNLIVLRTFSKAAGLAALRVGALFGKADLISTMRKAFTPYPVNSLALTAAEAAIADQKFMDAYIAEVRESRSKLTRGLEELGAKVFPTGANFVLADFGAGATRMVKKLAARGILIRDRASEFGRDGFVRITAGTIRQTEQLLAAIREEW
jgi:histidinol-phosphate aminotransferase